MSNEIKAVSFRLGEEDIQKFREFADEQGLNQAEMFQSLMNSFEMAKAKGMITDRAKEIEVFQDTINTLMNMFINSLVINQTSEERIREALSLELNTKDKTIADLQSREKELKIKFEASNEKATKFLRDANELAVKLENVNKEIDQKNNIINNQQEQINTLNSIVTEYKSYKDINKELELKNDDLNNKITDALHSNTDLQSKIENLENIKEFYKAQVESLKSEVKELNQNIKDIEKLNKNEIKALNRAHREELNLLEDKYKGEILSIRKELTDKFNYDLENKLEFEKVKYQLELDKIINKENLLKIQYDNLKAEFDKLNNK
ncbi:hypothetical protein A500_19244 [Clostridium sartagoforme AAU1]|uniref:Uncharacterized protein n=1 Tax=Clostridium sartagoforme AAU1 TaxID=1202534 RepID=R9BS52_9CLOT|nr:hypothetical protein [Clostridium sartagoforme]EOR19979.1 hypothetical protein A500_19244 [Clostridium sartagoforme AAU1]